MEKINREVKITFLEGKRIRLRLFTTEDINERYLSWLNDREVTKYMETDIFPTTLRV